MAKQQLKMSDEETEAKVEAKAAEKAKAKKEAERVERVKIKMDTRARVITFIEANKDELGDALILDIMFFVGVARAARAPRASINVALRIAFLEAGDKGLTEMEIFKAFKIGRPEMVVKIRIMVLTPNPADRVWVEFDEPNETYHVIGKGVKPPKGWTGYIPANKASL